MKTLKVNVTKDYSIFTRSGENRVLKLKKHRKLERSMQQYGFLCSFPISVTRDAHGKLVVKDGQHRLAIAQHLNLPVYWVEETVDYDVAFINATPSPWEIRDFAEKWAAEGRRDYIQALEFTDRHGIAIGTAFAMLAGKVEFAAIGQAYKDGAFKITDREYAESVAGIYGPITAMSPMVRKTNFLAACMAVCRVDGFDSSRLLKCAERCREKLVSYSTRDAFLDMLEVVYNFNQRKLVALKMEAVKALKSRSASARSVALKSLKAAQELATAQ